MRTWNLRAAGMLLGLACGLVPQLGLAGDVGFVPSERSSEKQATSGQEILDGYLIPNDVSTTGPEGLQQSSSALIPRPALPANYRQQEEPIPGETPLETYMREQGLASPFQTADGWGPTMLGYGTNSLLQNYGAYPGLWGGLGQYVSCEKKFFVALSQTADYVTNLSLPFAITPNNPSVFQDDWQFQTNVFAQALLYEDDIQKLTYSFNFYQALHPRVQELDLWAYSTGVQYTRSITDRLAGYLNYNYSYYYLDHVSLLSMNSITPGLLLHGNHNGDWLFSYTYADQQFRSSPTQTSNFNYVQLQRLQYLNCCRDRFVMAGYGYGNNDAVLDAWSYNLNNFYGGIGGYFGCDNRNQLLFLANYGNYQFSGFDVVEPTVIRQDKVWSLSAVATRTVCDHMSLFGQYTYYNSDSNIVRQNYNSSLISTGVQIWW